MRISELKIKKIIRRPTRQFDALGNRIYNEFEYDLPYNPTQKESERKRLYAKVIDLIPFLLVFYFVFSKIFLISLLFSVISVLIVGTISETVFGTTLGKKLFKLKVIDDFGHQPKIIRSALRNILSLVNFFLVFSDFEPSPNEYWAKSGTQLNFSMHLNNQVTKTFIIKENQMWEIRKLLDKADLNKKLQ